MSFEPNQLGLFDAATMTGLEPAYKEEPKANRGKSRKADTNDDYEWAKPFLVGSNVWIHVGYGVWELMPLTSERARHKLDWLRASERFWGMP